MTFFPGSRRPFALPRIPSDFGSVDTPVGVFPCPQPVCGLPAGGHRTLRLTYSHCHREATVAAEEPALPIRPSTVLHRNSRGAVTSDGCPRNDALGRFRVAAH